MAESHCHSGRNNASEPIGYILQHYLITPLVEESEEVFGGEMGGGRIRMEERGKCKV